MLRNLQGENPRLPEGRFLVSLGHALMPHFRRQRGAMPASPLCPGPHWAVCGPDEGRRARDLRGDGVATKRDKQLAKLLPVLREGDTLQVTRLDRLSAHSRTWPTSPMGASRPAPISRCCSSTWTPRPAPGGLGRLAVLAACQRDVRRERPAEGIAQTKPASIYKGGVRRIDRARVRPPNTHRAAAQCCHKSMALSVRAGLTAVRRGE